MKTLKKLSASKIEDLTDRELGEYIRRLRNEAIPPKFCKFEEIRYLPEDANPFIHNHKTVWLINEVISSGFGGTVGLHCVDSLGYSVFVKKENGENLGLPTSLPDILMMIGCDNGDEYVHVFYEKKAVTLEFQSACNGETVKPIVIDVTEKNIENQDRETLISLINLLR